MIFLFDLICRQKQSLRVKKTYLCGAILSDKKQNTRIQMWFHEKKF